MHTEPGLRSLAAAPHQVQPATDGWVCPICGDPALEPAFSTLNDATEGGVAADTFRPSSDQFGQLVGAAVRCAGCGHAAVQDIVSEDAISDAYADASDPVSLREEDGQVQTAYAGLRRIEAQRGGRGALLDVGCWTGSFLVAAAERGWHAEGVEPSRWAAARAQARGASVFVGQLEHARFPAGGFDAVVCCDVLEHLADPGAAVDRFAELLCPGGVLYLTVPDAGSRLARVMGRRWWSVLPMHLQYFNRTSMRELLVRHGFDVRQVHTHPKAFSARYYTERLASFVPGLGPLVERAVGRTRVADRLIAPDFGDRMEVVAVRRR